MQGRYRGEAGEMLCTLDARRSSVAVDTRRSAAAFAARDASAPARWRARRLPSERRAEPRQAHSCEPVPAHAQSRAVMMIRASWWHSCALSVMSRMLVSLPIGPPWSRDMKRIDW